MFKVLRTQVSSLSEDRRWMPAPDFECLGVRIEKVLEKLAACLEL